MRWDPPVLQMVPQAPLAILVRLDLQVPLVRPVPPLDPLVALALQVSQAPPALLALLVFLDPQETRAEPAKLATRAPLVFPVTLDLQVPLVRPVPPLDPPVLLVSPVPLAPLALLERQVKPA